MELTVKQITSKINQTEKKIDEYSRYIKNYQTWIVEAETDKNSLSISTYKKSLRECEKKLNKYVAQLAEFKGMLDGKVKEYPIVRRFVENWKKYAISVITNPNTIEECLSDYSKMKDECKRIEEDYKAKKRPSYESYNERCGIEKSFTRTWGFVWNYFNPRTKEINMEKLEKDYTYEATRKYNKFIEDTEFYVGEITDTSNLSIGDKGDINGFVVGTKGKARVETISACGEIQRFHYRTLYKMVK